MKGKEKVFTAIALTTATIAAAAAVNKLIFRNAIKCNLLEKKQGQFYKWRFGSVYYEKYGQGQPLLLVHDLSPASSSYEWQNCIAKLSKHYSVYVFDLLGCGRSEKPNLVYTNFMYSQLINDFIKEVIGRRTNVAATGSSCSLILTACLNSPDSFDKIFLISPESLKACAQIPTKISKLYMNILDIPVLGTMIYNIAFSKKLLKEMFYSKFADCSQNDISQLVCRYHEGAHLGSSASKSLYASIKGRYTNFNVNKALREIDNSIFMIGGADSEFMDEIISSYRELNPAIESTLISGCKDFPVLEDASSLADTILRF